MVHRNSAADCLRPPLSETLPVKCQQLRKGFGDCRRGMIDMRKRFRGNAPPSARMLQTGDEGSEKDDKQGYQLYAGRAAFGGEVKATSGNEKEAPDWREVENQKYRQEQANKKS